MSQQVFIFVIEIQLLKGGLREEFIGVEEVLCLIFRHAS